MSWYGGARGLEGKPSRPAGGRLAANFSTPPGGPIGRDAIGDVLQLSAQLGQPRAAGHALRRPAVHEPVSASSESEGQLPADLNVACRLSPFFEDSFSRSISLMAFLSAMSSSKGWSAFMMNAFHIVGCVGNNSERAEPVAG